MADTRRAYLAEESRQRSRQENELRQAAQQRHEVFADKVGRLTLKPLNKAYQRAKE